MKNSIIESDNGAGSETIAFFDTAKIVCRPDGKYQIIGGSIHDRKQAAQWAARFLDVRFSASEVISG